MKKVTRIFATALLATGVLGGCSRGGGEKGPDETLEHAMRSVADQKPEELWNLMPAGYQEQVNTRVRAIGGKVDGEIVKGVFEFVNFVGQRLQENRAKLLESPDIQKLHPDAAIRTAVYDSVVDLVKTVGTSELSSVDRIKSFDGGKFIAQVGGAGMRVAEAVGKTQPENPFAKFREQAKSVDVKLVKQDGETATVEYDVPGKNEKKTVELAKVEGRWIPVEMKAEWPKVIESLGQAEQQVAMLNSQKDQILPGLAMARGFVEAAMVSGQLGLPGLPGGDPSQLMQGFMGGGAAAPDAAPFGDDASAQH